MSDRTSRLIVVFAILYFVTIGLFTTFSTDRIAWFDEAFTLETAKILQEGDINFYEYDVHPPVYYLLLGKWMEMQPAFTETQWARLFSMACGVVFFIFLYLSLRQLPLSRYVSAGVTLLTSLSTTLIHYFTEIRMYALLLMLSAVSLYFLLKIINGKATLSTVLPLFFISALAPFVHYFGFMIGAFSTGVMLLTFTCDDWKSMKGVFFSHIIVWGTAIIFAGHMALIQRSRIARMWFEASDIGSFPSAILFPFYYPEWAPLATDTLKSTVFLISMSLLQIALVGLFLYIIVKIFMKVFFKGVKDKKTIVIMCFLLTAILPLLALILSKYVLDLYHHRFVLVMLWMWMVGLYILFMEWFECKLLDGKKVGIFFGSLALVVFFAIGGLAQSIYIEYTPTQMDEVYSVIPCGTHVLHDTPFTYISQIIYDREHGCEHKRTLVTLLSWGESRSAGFDAINPDDVVFLEWTGSEYWSIGNEQVAVLRGDEQYIPYGEFYYITRYRMFVLMEPSNGEVVYEREGYDEKEAYWTILFVNNTEKANVQIQFDG